ncbi:MAG: YhbY family RNA-binding protein [Firmicutes bacterium]|nr:YhbY family RNA-binding protein [Bacillota bacterium]
MLSSKQRAILRGLASAEDTILHVGKGDLGENIVKQAADALQARELVKGRVLETSGLSPKEAADQIASKTGSEVVQVIGGKFVLYKPNPKERKIDLPDTRKKR